MGAECSATLARPPATCQPQLATCQPQLAACRTCEPCSPCEDGDEPLSSDFQLRAHPLLNSVRDQETPRTPRGPAPPWASMAAATSSRADPVDRTSTGCTPPARILARSVPPGVPDEEDPSRLVLKFGKPFLRDLVVAIQSGDTAALEKILSKLYPEARQALFGDSPSTENAAREKERESAVDEAVSAFLSIARDPDTGDPLLSIATRGGHHLTVLHLLGCKADPFARDSTGRTVLHAAAEAQDGQQGSLVSALMLLDRMQGTQRSLRLSDLADKRGSSPDDDIKGEAPLHRAFEAFSQMQVEAELRSVGAADMSGFSDDGLDGVGVCGASLVSLIDVTADIASKAGQAASVSLRRTALGTGLVRHMHRRAPEYETQVRRLVDHVGNGLRKAETLLLREEWHPEDPSLSPPARRFAVTAEVRMVWQRLRGAVEVRSGCAEDLLDFWETHLTAESMISTLGRIKGETFQVLLIILWLYTRESWLPHILDALAAALAVIDCCAQGAEGTTGATPLSAGRATSEPIPSLLAPLVEAMSPFAQLVQSSLNYFDDRGIRHEGEVYRPVHLTSQALREIVHKVSCVRGASAISWRAAGRMRPGEDDDEDKRGRSIPWTAGVLGTDVWLALGASSFFSAMSSRAAAAERLQQTRCNVLLAIRPDRTRASHPKHLSLRCGGVNDVIFSLGTIFRVTRVSRAISDELAGEQRPQQAVAETSTPRDGVGLARWPVTILELSACERTPEILEALERRGELQRGELEAQLEEWSESAGPSERHHRALAAGQLLLRCPVASSTPRDATPAGPTLSACRSEDSSVRTDRACALLGDAAAHAESLQDHAVQAKALLAGASFRASDETTPLEDVEAAGEEAERAIALLEKNLGGCHPDVCAARDLMNNIGLQRCSGVDPNDKARTAFVD